jgi:AraC-like DNA-binding protein
MRNQRLCGGLVVVGVKLDRPSRAGTLDRRLLGASRQLLELATRHDLTNAALLAAHRHAARRERDRAEAIHELKDRLHDDIRSTYLHEEPALLAAIRRGERPEARRIINRILVGIYAAGGTDTNLLKSLALELVVMMTRAAVQAGGDPAVILGLNYQSLTALSGIVDPEALAVWLCDMLEQLIDAIKTNTRHPNSVQLARAIDYIEEHLADELSREEVARAAGLSPSHFSHLMRAKTGWSFTELLTRLRIDRACHLLAQADQPLAQIAQACGFGDQSYFTRVFRKRTGQTPGEYRTGRSRPG